MVYILDLIEFTSFLESFILTPKGQATIDFIICKVRIVFYSKRHPYIPLDVSNG